MDLLPDAWNGEEEGRLDLAEVGLDRLDRLGEVEHHPAASIVQVEKIRSATWHNGR